jgi:uncharacterized membrane protein
MLFLRSRTGALIKLLLLTSLVSIGLCLGDAIANHSAALIYWIYNLFLAWLPILFIGWLLICLKKWPWLNWRPMLLTVLWLSFLPNSFYLVSDLIHLQGVGQSHVLFDSVMFESFIINGLMLGYLSVFLIHNELLKRISARMSTFLIGLSLFLCSYAIYLGRDLRWSSWDLLINFPGILFDVSETITNPKGHVQAFTTTLTFFVFISVFYILAWRATKIIRKFGRPAEA